MDANNDYLILIYFFEKRKMNYPKCRRTDMNCKLAMQRLLIHPWDVTQVFFLNVGSMESRKKKNVHLSLIIIMKNLRSFKDLMLDVAISFVFPIKPPASSYIFSYNILFSFLFFPNQKANGGTHLDYDQPYWTYIFKIKVFLKYVDRRK